MPRVLSRFLSELQKEISDGSRNKTEGQSFLSDKAAEGTLPRLLHFPFSLVGVSVGVAVGVGVDVSVGVGVAFFVGAAVTLTETDSADAFCVSLLLYVTGVSAQAETSSSTGSSTGSAFAT